jgi:predicted phage tail component-like protein
MATTPSALAGTPAVVKIDGVDLHTFGVSVTSVDNPVPAAKGSAVDVPGMHGDYDYSRKYGVRVITLSGRIIGDTHAQLMANVDELKSWLRLKENREPMKLIFQNQTGRYWLVTYSGEFSIRNIGVWKVSHTADFSIRFKCVRPYAEAVSITSETTSMHVLKSKPITYPGTIDAPVRVSVSPRYAQNMLELAAGAPLGDTTQHWTAVNSGLALDTAIKLFGASSLRVTRTAAGSYYAQYTSGSLPLLGALNTSKHYVVGCHFYTVSTDAVRANCKLQFIVFPSNVTKEVVIDGWYSAWYFGFVKLEPANFSGGTSAAFRVHNNGTDSMFRVSGAFIYEITPQEYSDSNYFPPPYMSDAGAGGDHWVPPKNLGFQLYRGGNIIPFKNGEDASSWPTLPERVSVVSDPFGGDDLCLLYSSTLIGSPERAESQRFYLTPGKPYSISFDYYIENIVGGAVYAGIREYDEAGGLTTAKILEESAANTQWEHYSGTKVAEKATKFGAFVFVTVSCTAKIFIKNVMVVELANQADPPGAYRPVDMQKAQYLDVLDSGDVLILDFERLLAQHHDWNGGVDSKSITKNAMEKFTGDRLLLSPGNNVLRLIDAREGSANPHTESSGAASVTVSYRARYL